MSGKTITFKIDADCSNLTAGNIYNVILGIGPDIFWYIGRLNYLYKSGKVYEIALDNCYANKYIPDGTITVNSIKLSEFDDGIF